MNKKLKSALIPIVERLTPVARVAERVAGLAVHIQKPSLIGMTGMVATGLSSLAEQLGNNRTPGAYIRVLIAKGQFVRALEEAGVRMVYRAHHEGASSIECSFHGMRFIVNPNGSLSTTEQPSAEFFDWLGQTIERVLPPAIEVRQIPHDNRNGGESYEARALAPITYTNDQAKRIMASTLPLIAGGRSILLDGKPGVGKTTMARIIARDSGLGRTVMLDGPILGGSREERYNTPAAHHAGNELKESLRLLSPGVIIVDDVDKLYLSLATLESLRAAAKLVILTANNGMFDDVLDGSLTRAGRVDEVFTIEPVKIVRESPYDQLTDAEWNEVSQWPIAYLAEVKKRLLHRPKDLRLDDLRARLDKKTRSGDVLR